CHFLASARAPRMSNSCAAVRSPRFAARRNRRRSLCACAIVRRATRPHAQRLKLFRDHRKDQDVLQLSVVSDPLVAERALELVAGALGDAAAAHVGAVAADLDALGAEGVEGEAGDAADGFRDVALAFEAGAAPVADLEAGHAPVHAV